MKTKYYLLLLHHNPSYQGSFSYLSGSRQIYLEEQGAWKFEGDIFDSNCSKIQRPVSTYHIPLFKLNLTYFLMQKEKWLANILPRKTTSEQSKNKSSVWNMTKEYFHMLQNAGVPDSNFFVTRFINLPTWTAKLNCSCGEHRETRSTNICEYQ